MMGAETKSSLTEDEFQAADDAVAARQRARDPVAGQISAEWEAANSLPDRTWQNRKDRLRAIAAVAVRYELVRS